MATAAEGISLPENLVHLWQKSFVSKKDPKKYPYNSLTPNPKFESTKSVSINREYAVKSIIRAGIYFATLTNSCFYASVLPKFLQSRDSNDKNQTRERNFRPTVSWGRCSTPSLPPLASALPDVSSSFNGSIFKLSYFISF